MTTTKAVKIEIQHITADLKHKSSCLYLEKCFSLVLPYIPVASNDTEATGPTYAGSDDTGPTYPGSHDTGPTYPGSDDTEVLDEMCLHHLRQQLFMVRCTDVVRGSHSLTGCTTSHLQTEPHRC